MGRVQLGESRVEKRELPQSKLQRWQEVHQAKSSGEANGGQRNTHKRSRGKMPGAHNQQKIDCAPTSQWRTLVMGKAIKMVF